MKKFGCNKLARDLVKKKLDAQNIRSSFRTLSKLEHIEALKTKLLEEADEVVRANNPQELIEELADLSEVILALTKLLGLSSEKIEEKRRQKKSGCGGFEEALYLEHIEVPLDSDRISYFLGQPHKYPEILD